MTTFIKAQEIGNDQMNIDKYRISATTTEKHIRFNLPKDLQSKILDEQAIISCQKKYVKCQKSMK